MFHDPSYFNAVETKRTDLSNGDTRIDGEIVSIQLPGGDIVPPPPGSTFRITFREAPDDTSWQTQYTGEISLGGGGITTATGTFNGVSGGTMRTRRVGGNITWAGDGIETHVGGVSFTVNDVRQSVNFTAKI